MPRFRFLASISVALSLCLFSSEGIAGEENANEGKLSEFQACVLANRTDCLEILSRTHDLTFDRPSLDQEAQFRWRWGAIWSDFGSVM